MLEWSSDEEAIEEDEAEKNRCTALLALVTISFAKKKRFLDRDHSEKAR